MRGQGNQFEDRCIILMLKHLIADFIYPVLFSILQTLHSALTFCLRTLPECRYLTNLPVYSHSTVWIQDIPHTFHFFLLYSHFKINVLLQLITVWFFFTIVYILYGYTKEGNILLTHIYLMCYRLCQQPHPQSYLLCIDGVSYPFMLVFSQWKNNRLY